MAAKRQRERRERADTDDRPQQKVGSNNAMGNGEAAVAFLRNSALDEDMQDPLKQAFINSITYKGNFKASGLLNPTRVEQLARLANRAAASRLESILQEARTDGAQEGQGQGAGG
eukprot:jgi/Mesvir1/7102/Mv09208-RA.1